MANDTCRCERFVFDRAKTPVARRQCRHEGEWKPSLQGFYCARHETAVWDSALRSPEMSTRWEALRAELVNQERLVTGALTQRWS